MTSGETGFRGQCSEVGGVFLHVTSFPSRSVNRHSKLEPTISLGLIENIRSLKKTIHYLLDVIGYLISN